MIVFTRRFWLLLAAGVPVAAVAAILGSPAIAIVYDVFLFIAAAISVRLGPSPEHLRLRRRFDPVLSVRAANKVTVTVENESGEPISMLLREEPPASCDASQKEFRLALAGDESKDFTYTLTPLWRGDDVFRGSYVRIDCPLGLAVKQVRLDTEEAVRVYPNVLALKEFDLLKQQGRLKEIGIRRSRSRGLGMEFESLREYGEGDDYRKIDWKASARRGKLVVRQYEQEKNQCVLLCIDIGRHMLSEVNGITKLDHVLDALLMLTNAAALAGDFVGVMVYADTVRRYIPPRKGRNQVGAIIEAIHDLIAEPVESDPVAAFGYLATRWKRRSLLVNFTDYEDEDRGRELAAALTPMARRHLSLICRVTDPRMEEVLHTPITERDHMYQRAAAAMLMEDRRNATTLVTATGVQNLDSEPQDLAAKLVSYYFMVKERSLL